ncbi:MAG: hypothetical protein LBL00_07445 [Endomicrobium sp.]|jgi:hypothetical protein|nr:hypothetical protein [Endomicrobium sp.]
MNINGWDYNFKSLPYWDNREKFPYVYDLLFENEQADIAFLIYSITEVTMCYYVGFLAIFKNKEKPELLLNATKGGFLNEKVIFSIENRFAFVKSAIYIKKGWPIFIFDLLNRQFACLKIIPNSKNDLMGRINETKIEIDKLKWMPFERLDSFCSELRDK